MLFRSTYTKVLKVIVVGPMVTLAPNSLNPYSFFPSLIPSVRIAYSNVVVSPFGPSEALGSNHSFIPGVAKSESGLYRRKGCVVYVGPKVAKNSDFTTSRPELKADLDESAAAAAVAADSAAMPLVISAIGSFKAWSSWACTEAEATSTIASIEAVLISILFG